MDLCPTDYCCIHTICCHHIKQLAITTFHTQNNNVIYGCQSQHFFIFVHKVFLPLSYNVCVRAYVYESQYCRCITCLLYVRWIINSCLRTSCNIMFICFRPWSWVIAFIKCQLYYFCKWWATTSCGTLEFSVFTYKLGILMIILPVKWPHVIMCLKTFDLSSLWQINHCLPSELSDNVTSYME